ncbi:MAG TPA: winged helix-turn-helix domain-containing protein [Acidimicrobiia bacterium]|jgi:DNA-binding response OmpR family regulator
MEVVLVRWPEEGERLGQLRVTGAPRLLLLNGECELPQSVDCLEDWIRLPAEAQDMRARIARLASLSETEELPPQVDGDGLLRYRGRWVALPPVEGVLVAALVDRFGAVVGRATLSRRTWPDGEPTRALDVSMLRLRRRIAPLGLEVRTVHSRGFLMQAGQRRADAQ